MRRNTAEKSGLENTKEPAADEVGRLFLRVDGISRFIVSSPGDISVKYKLSDVEPQDAEKDMKRRS
jgi:hypothetical protein